MNQRVIGSNNVGEIGLGCMGMSHAYGPSNESENLKVLDRAIELDCNFWDTADFYGAGKNENLLGKFLQKHRNKVFLATKVGNVYDRELTTHQDQVESKAPWIVDGTPDYIRKCIDRSLQRLGVDCIDLYYLHRVDPLVPIEESVGAMSELVKQGKVRYLGLSEASSDTIRRAMKVHPIVALQTEYSLWSRDVEDDILPTCREFGITLVAYAPLGRGFLTGEIHKVDDLSSSDCRHSFPRFQGDNFQENIKIVEVINRIAERHGVTAAQVSIAWVLSQGNNIIPIPGTRRIKYLEQNVSAADICLSDTDLNELSNLHAAGQRYPEIMQGLVCK